MFIKLFNLYVPIRKMIFFVLESLLICCSIIFFIYFRFMDVIPYSYCNTENFSFKCLVIVITVQLPLYYFGLYNIKIFSNNLQFILRLFSALGVSSISLYIIYYFFPQLIIGSEIFFLSLGPMVTVMIVWRFFYKYLINNKMFNQKTLIIGTGSLAKQITRTILERRDTGFEVIGFITDDPKKVGLPLVNPSIIGDYSTLSELVRREKPQRIIVALNEYRGKFPQAQLLDFKMQGIAIEDGINFYEHLTGRLHIKHLRPSALIFSEGFKKPKTLLLLKRSTELFISIIALILSLPLILLISLAIVVDSRGPVFYRQERVGKDNQNFSLLKFRSMLVNAETNGPVWASEKDHRITRVGHWLRKLRLDEIPQMINVLKGDMSFVGPRPERPYFVEQLKKEIPYYDRRHSIKPGVTGWAQIKYPYGASINDALEKLNYDFYYIKNLSFLLDLIIIFETIKVVLFGKGSR